MHPNEFIPDSIFEHPHCAIVYAFLLRNLSPISRRTMIDGNPLEIKPNQAIIRKPLDSRLPLSEPEVDSALKLLVALKEVEVRDIKPGYLVELRSVPVRRIEDVAETGESGDRALPEITFRVFSGAYLDHVKQNGAPKTLENSKRVMKFAVTRFGEKLLSRLGSQDLEEFKQWRLEGLRKSKGEGAGVTTVNIDTRTLKAALEYAIDWGYLHKNPFRRVRAIAQQKMLPAYLSKEDLENLLLWERNPVLQTIYAFAALTGMRRGEILNLEWKDVDFDLRTITIQSSPNYRVKHGKNRIIPISEGVRQLLRSTGRHDPFVFMTPNDKPIKDDYVTKAFKKAVRALGLDPRLKFHSLRATCASRLAQEGVPVLYIKEVLGHAYVKTTESYTRIPSTELHGAMEKLTLPPTVRWQSGDA